jgi:hypothetical protein
MRIRGSIIEYDLNEAAKLLELSTDELERRVEAGSLRYYYQLKSEGYRFHEASIFANRQLLEREHRSPSKMLSM